MVEFLFHVTGVYPKWYPEDQRYKGPIKARIGCVDFQKAAGEVIIPALEEWLDMSLVAKKIRNPIGIPVKWILKNGSIFDILTYEQNTDQYEGWKGHLAWFDEPPPRDKYIATVRGLVDFSGRMMLTLTPLTQPWVYDEIYTNNQNFCVTMDIRDNPHLSESDIQEFESKLSLEEKEARIHGKFLHLTGLIYKTFEQNIHICEPPRVDKWTRYFCIDPHPRTPTACLWLAVDPHDNHVIYDELWLKDMDIEQIAHCIHAQEGDNPAQVRFIDPEMDKDSTIAGGFNIRKELAKYGVFCQRADNQWQLGYDRINRVLKPRYIHALKSETPQLRVSRNCVETIFEFQHYIWGERRRDVGLTERNTAKKANDHFMDCLRYIYNYNPRYLPPVDESDGEIVYKGEYAKYPTKQLSTSGKGAYGDLIDGRAGRF